jgi:hypothetical protein
MHISITTCMAAVSDQNGTVPFKLGPDNDASASEVGEDGSGYSVSSVCLDDELLLLNGYAANGRNCCERR